MPAKSKDILALFIHLGFEIKQGKKHAKATNPASGNSITLPRHVEVTNGVVDNICKFLLDEGVEKATIKHFIR